LRAPVAARRALFGRIESLRSLSELETLGRITAKCGVPLASADEFVQSLWIDDGWGPAGRRARQPLASHEVARATRTPRSWRRAPKTSSMRHDHESAQSSPATYPIAQSDWPVLA
jgi:hypothetical protein